MISSVHHGQHICTPNQSAGDLSSQTQTPYLDLNLVALFKLFHLTVLVAQLRSSILQLLLTDLPEGIDLVLHTQTHCPR